jgi:hypothetical protein
MRLCNERLMMQRVIQHHMSLSNGGLYLIRLRNQIRSGSCLRPEPLLFNSLQAFEFRVPSANSRRVRFGKKFIADDFEPD